VENFIKLYPHHLMVQRHEEDTYLGELSFSVEQYGLLIDNFEFRLHLLQPNEQIQIEVIDTNDPDFDPIANAPAGYPARRSIFWIRSTDADVAHYRLEQRKDAGTWSTVANRYDRAGKWAYILQTGILVDLASYEWRIIPVDHAGNDGDSISLAAETIVRTPDAPNFALAFDEITRRVTFSEIA
jgi:hypothetical protein